MGEALAYGAASAFLVLWAPVLFLLFRSREHIAGSPFVWGGLLGLVLFAAPLWALGAQDAIAMAQAEPWRWLLPACALKAGLLLGVQGVIPVPARHAMFPWRWHVPLGLGAGLAVSLGLFLPGVARFLLLWLTGFLDGTGTPPAALFPADPGVRGLGVFVLFVSAVVLMECATGILAGLGRNKRRRRWVLLAGLLNTGYLFSLLVPWGTGDAVLVLAAAWSGAGLVLVLASREMFSTFVSSATSLKKLRRTED